MNAYEDDEEEEQVQKTVIPKYKLLFEDSEVESKMPLPEGEEREQTDEKKEPEGGEGGEAGEGDEDSKPKKKIDKILLILAEILNAEANKTKSDKEICKLYKDALDKDEELNQPSISSPEIEENGVWQVIIGKQFASSVTFDARYIFYFQLEESRKYFLVFRS